MKYDLEVKAEAVEMYKKGTPRREISETMEIPLSTIRNWTQNIESAPLSIIKCAFCGEKQRIQNIQQKYCSKSCKNRAHYLRCRERMSEPGPETPLICQHCGKRYTPKHANAIRYCSGKCRRSAANERRREQRYQSHVQSAPKEHFHRCLKTVEQSRKDALSTTIDSNKYRTEIDTIEQYYAKNRSSLSQREFERVQDVFRSVK